MWPVVWQRLLMGGKLRLKGAHLVTINGVEWPKTPNEKKRRLSMGPKVGLCVARVFLSRLF